ncbi:MAG: 50S ribosomal protein L11 methyltransferase [Prevotellaceae bacterium]|jgi:ribosomal protein L11 methyltransferase|nr:50S ribosomal protein L11 methyltransferase [Prevotellaceae bacterium]
MVKNIFRTRTWNCRKIHLILQHKNIAIPSSMNYIKITIPLNNAEDYIFDILSQELAEIGFESFETSDTDFYAYIPENVFDNSQIVNILENFDYAKIADFATEKIISKDWNEEWEKNFFNPIVIADKCVIHSSFHTNVPPATYDIVINPKMAFGTGHHFTTRLMLAFILETDFEGKTLLDMGCGTAILAILAMMRGAKYALAVDIDDWCVENSQENILINKIENIDLLCGDVKVLKNRKFDVVLANINRNILLADMVQYAECLNENGQLFISGFYDQDLPFLEKEAAKHHLQLIDTKVDNHWTAAKFAKKDK